VNFLTSCGDIIITTEDRITIESSELLETDFIVSYGYRHIIKEDIVKAFKGRAINLHISLLPWNRGADPNLWSFLEDTPKGVTIHYIDRGIDTGDIIVQEEVVFLQQETLRTSYERLSLAIEDLFIRAWPDIRNSKIQPIKQSTGGSSHCLKDRSNFEHLLVMGWDTPVAELIGKAKETIVLGH